jgi:hypothetical protein
MKKMAGSVGREAPNARPTGPADPMTAEYWDPVLKDAGADARQAGPPIQSRRLSEIDQHVLRVS